MEMTTKIAAMDYWNAASWFNLLFDELPPQTKLEVRRRWSRKCLGRTDWSCFLEGQIEAFGGDTYYLTAPAPDRIELLLSPHRRALFRAYIAN